MFRPLAVATALIIFSKVTAAQPPVCDALLITGIDVSNSVEAAGIEMQFAGIAGALRSPQLVQAMTGGPHGCIGFAVFAWSDGAFPIVADWHVISSGADAETVAALIDGAKPEARLGALTDLSGGLEHAETMLQTAPIASPRWIYNTMGDGEDNVGEGPQLASQRMRAAGITINAVAFGPSTTLEAYLRANVTGGRSSFVMPISESANIVNAMISKFRMDLSMVME